MVFLINNLLDKLLFKLRTLNPKYYRELDDNRIDTYYISLNSHNFMVLYGLCGECDSIAIYNNNNINYNIMTTQGIENFVNNYNEQIDNTSNIIFELELDTFNGSINDLLLLLTNSVNNIILF